MKASLGSVLCVLLCATFFTFTGEDLQAQSKKKGGNSTVPKIILDTDIGPDYDDVGAIAMLHALADKGEINPLAVISCNKNALTVPVISLLNTYFGRQDLPVGVVKGGGPDMGASQKWPEKILKQYPHAIKHSEDAPDAVEIYRKILSRQSDHSVTIVTIGFLTNLSNLLKSEPDKYSKLNGLELVRKKVKSLVSMAGEFPKGREFNIHIDSISAEYTFTNWPTGILFSGFEIGKQVKTGLRLIGDKELHGPVKEVFGICIPFARGDSEGRMSWDQTAVLVGARGTADYYAVENGRIKVKGGNNTWERDPNGPHARLLPKMPVPELTTIIEDLMMYTPRKIH